MKTLQLTQGYTALVDDADFDELNRWKWSALINKKTGKIYAVRGASIGNGKTKTLLMHKFLMPESEVDHRDGNGLNNQRSNLRYCSHLQNLQNKKVRKSNRTGFKGVGLKKCGRFAARIKLDGKEIWLGYFDTAIEAAKIYNTAAVKHFGEFAWLNPIPNT